MPIPRHELTALLAQIDQQIAEAEALTVDALLLADDVLLGASQKLAELRETKREVERKLAQKTTEHD